MSVPQELPKPMPTVEEAIAAGAQVVEGAQEPMSARAQEMLGVTPILTGERQTGLITRPDGTGTVAEITPDGMKQERNIGSLYARPRYDSAADFHAAQGNATPGERAKVAAASGEASPTQSGIRRALGSIGIGKRR